MDEDSNYSNFFDIITSNLLVPHIIHPTRITPTSRTLIDNIFSNATNYDEGISGNITVSLSDHLAQFLIIPQESDHFKEKKTLYIYDWKKFDSENFLFNILNAEWSVENFDDPNDAFENFQEKVNNIINHHLHKRKMTKKEVQQKQKPWITNDILKLIHKRNIIYKNFVKANDKTLKELLFKSYKTIRNLIVSECRNSKKLYYQNYFLNNSNNIRNTWQGIKSIINLDGRDKLNPTSILIDDDLVTEPKEVANQFNNYFSNIASKLQASIYTQGQDFNKYLKNNAEHSFFIKSTDKYEIIDIINKNLNNKASGPNSIPNLIIHLIKLIIAKPLADIINLSFKTGIYIDKLKISRITPIYKDKGNNLVIENYRPISLLSNINKNFEKIMHKRLYGFFEKQGFFYEKQFGFRQEHSTTHALIDLTEDIRQAIDINKFSCGIFIDLQKAFDTVDHNILLRKLEHYGVRGISNNWFHSYLNNRKQYVSISGSDSKVTNIDFGVPQGSVLGPLLFLIYINDLNHAINYSKTRHFADDTNILNNNHSLKQLQKQLNFDLKQLCNWLKANKISLNCSKTELIIFRHPNKKLNYDLKIKINGKKLIPTNSVKYLGITLDPHLNWSSHVDSLSSKLNRITGMLAKVRHFVPEHTLRNIYFGIFSSLLTYGSQVWGQFFNKHIFRLERIQNKAIRIINFANYRDNTAPLYYKSKILKLSDHIKLENFNYVHNSFNGKLPQPLKNYFQLIANTHHFNTRCANKLNITLPKVRTQMYGLNSITYQSAAFWNFIVNILSNKQLYYQSKAVCKKYISKYFFDSYIT